MIEGHIKLLPESPVEQDTEAVEVNNGWQDKNFTNNHIPSYIGLSCAVSGYRPINKYDAVTREVFISGNSPTRIARSRGLISNGSPITPDQSNISNYLAQHVIDDGPSMTSVDSPFPLLKTSTSSRRMDFPSNNINGHTSVHCSQVIKIEQFSNVNNCGSPHLAQKGLNHFSSSATDKEDNGKSFVQQRIERLYGPAALGMAFQAKRVLLERLKSKELEEKNENNSFLKDGTQGLPSVFRHLRPEFRHQLPVKTKYNCTSPTNGSTSIPNGQRIRHVPIQLEATESSQELLKGTPDKSWRSLSIELDNISKTPEKENVVPITEKQNCTLPSPSRVEVPQDGNYFLKVVAAEVALLEPEIQKIDTDLDSFGESMSEEVKGKLLSASGKAKLLIRQKIEQFKGLCMQNISKSETEEFPTTNEDLAGFWDMVVIQVDNLKTLFREVDKLRSSDWKEEPKVHAPPTSKNVILNRKLKRETNGIKSNEIKNQAQQKANEERRRQMRESLNAKRKEANKAKMGDEIEIFVPSK